MTNIYDKKNKAFSNCSGYIVMYNGEPVATVAFKWGNTGNVRVFLHWIGLVMTEGNAGGGGYDKASAAMQQAARKTVIDSDSPDAENARNFIRAIMSNDGNDWNTNLRKHGFIVQGVI